MKSSTNIVGFYYKIQSELIKDLQKRARLYFGENEEDTYFSVEGHSIFLIPKRFSVLNIEKLRTENLEIKSDLIDNLKRAEYKSANMTGYIFSPNGDKLATLVNGDLTVYVNKKLLKLIPKEATYNIASDKQPVEVKIGEEVIAYVRPVKLPKE